MATVSLRQYNLDIETLIDHGQTDEAISHSKHILQIFPKHLDTYRLLGKALLESQRYKEAADVFQRVIASVPDDFVSHIGLSIIYENEGNIDEATWHMERAYEIQSSNAAVQEELRRLYGRRDGIEPPRIRLTRGALVRMYTRGNLLHQAISEIKAALESDPQRYDLQVLLARVYFLSGQIIEATEICSTLLRRYPFCYEANRILAEILPGTSRADEADIYLQRISALDPYIKYISPTSPSLADIPENSVSLEQLQIGEFDRSDLHNQIWAKSLDIEKDTSSSEQADGIHPEPISSSWNSPEYEPVPSTTDIGDEDIPDWLKSAGWMQSDDDIDEDTTVMENSISPQGDVAPAEIPSWIQSIAPQSNAANIEDDPTAKHDDIEFESSVDNIQFPPTTASNSQGVLDWLNPLVNEQIQAPDWIISGQSDSSTTIENVDQNMLPDDWQPEPISQELVKPEQDPELSQDETQAWLEDLAALHGSEAETLIARKEDRFLTPPPIIKNIASTQSDVSNAEEITINTGPEDDDLIINTVSAPDFETSSIDKYSGTSKPHERDVSETMEPEPQKRSGLLSRWFKKLFSREPIQMTDIVETFQPDDHETEQQAILDPFPMGSDGIPPTQKEVVRTDDREQVFIPLIKENKDWIPEIQPTSLDMSSSNLHLTEKDSEELSAPPSPEKVNIHKDTPQGDFEPEQNQYSEINLPQSMFESASIKDEKEYIDPLLDEPKAYVPTWLQQVNADRDSKVDLSAVLPVEGTSPEFSSQFEGHLENLIEESETHIESGSLLAKEISSQEIEETSPPELISSEPILIQEGNELLAEEPQQIELPTEELPSWLQNLTSHHYSAPDPIEEVQPDIETTPVILANSIYQEEIDNDKVEFSIPEAEIAEHINSEIEKTQPMSNGYNEGTQESEVGTSLAENQAKIAEPINGNEQLYNDQTVSHENITEFNSSSIITEHDQPLEYLEDVIVEPEASDRIEPLIIEELNIVGHETQETELIKPDPMDSPVEVDGKFGDIVDHDSKIKQTRVDYDMILGHAKNAMAQGDIELAISVYAQVIQGEYALDQVISQLATALDQFPGEPSLWEALGDAHVRIHNLQLALDAYSRAEELLTDE